MKIFQIDEHNIPPDAPRALRVAVCEEASVLREEVAQRFKEYLKLVKIPHATALVSSSTVPSFLDSIGPAIIDAAVEGRRFVRLPIPKDLDCGVITEWLAASGYQSHFTQLELTISW